MTSILQFVILLRTVRPFFCKRFSLWQNSINFRNVYLCDILICNSLSVSSWRIYSAGIQFMVHLLNIYLIIYRIILFMESFSF